MATVGACISQQNRAVLNGRENIKIFHKLISKISSWGFNLIEARKLAFICEAEAVKQHYSICG
jgi:hypothetical protein